MKRKCVLVLRGLVNGPGEAESWPARNPNIGDSIECTYRELKRINTKKPVLTMISVNASVPAVFQGGLSRAGPMFDIETARMAHPALHRNF